MGRKPKFKPIITRVKLNPEQAVLTCACYNLGYNFKSGFIARGDGTQMDVCTIGARTLDPGLSCISRGAGTALGQQRLASIS